MTRKKYFVWVEIANGSLLYLNLVDCLRAMFGISIQSEGKAVFYA